jgi:hypothetical protein
MIFFVGLQPDIVLPRGIDDQHIAAQFNGIAEVELGIEINFRFPFLFPLGSVKPR